MAFFQYRARSATTGRLVQGTAEAENASDLVEQLRQTGYVPLSVRGDGRLGLWAKRLRKRTVLGTRDLSLLYGQLATMVRAGLPVITALDVLAGQERGPVRDAAGALHHQIVRGSSLAEAMTQSGLAFPPVQIDLIHSGELSGHLDTVLERLATLQQKELALRGKVRSAAIYPAVVMLVAAGVLTFMLLVVLPTFTDIFAELQAELPPLTRWMLALVETVRHRWALVLLLLAALVMGLRWWARTPRGRRDLESWVLRLPVFGRLQTLLVLGSISRNMAMLLGSGLPLMQVLEAAGQAAGNAVYRRALTDVRQGVTQGETLADSLRWTGVMPAFLVEMVQVGEESGSLDQMLSQVAAYYDRQAEEMAANLSALLEPVMLVVVGGIVALVLVSLFMPILTLLNAVKF